MKKILHILGIHDWKYGVPTFEKIRQPLRIGSPFNPIDTDKIMVGYAYFQRATCEICGKEKIERVD